MTTTTTAPIRPAASPAEQIERDMIEAMIRTQVWERIRHLPIEDAARVAREAARWSRVVVDPADKQTIGWVLAEARRGQRPTGDIRQRADHLYRKLTGLEGN